MSPIFSYEIVHKLVKIFKFPSTDFTNKPSISSFLSMNLESNLHLKQNYKNLSK